MRQRKHSRRSALFRHVKPPHRFPQDEDIGPPLYDTSFLERLHQEAGTPLRGVLQNAPEAQGLRPLESRRRTWNSSPAGLRASTPIHDGDWIEVVAPMQGG